MSDLDLSRHLGETVTLRGIAHDARAGAILEMADATPIYVAGLGSWERACSGKEVEVTGVLRVRPSPLSEAGPSGMPSHGLSDDTFVIDHASWKLVSS
jgi:hypothetical protein